MASDRSRSRWVWILGITALLIGSSLAVGVWQAVDAPAERPAFGTDVSDAQASLNGIAGHRETVVERAGETVTTVENVSRRPGTGVYRIETVTGPSAGAELKVSDGEILWLYDEDDERVTRIDRGDDSDPAGPDRIERLLTIVNRTDATEGTSTGTVSPLPVVPTEGGQAASTAGVAGSLTVRYEGTETVAGRSTYVFELTSNANTSAFVSEFSQTLWLDREWYVPLKRATHYRRGDENVSITVGYRNVTFNPGFEAGTFRFDPPPGVIVEDADRPQQMHFADRAGLRAASSVPVPNPSLPDSFGLAGATRTVGNGIRSIGLRYTNATAQVMVSKSNLTWYEPVTEGTPVAVGGQEATLRNLGTELRVSWTCGGSRYSVAGTGVSSDLLVEIARSIGCERAAP